MSHGHGSQTKHRYVYDKNKHQLIYLVRLIMGRQRTSGILKKNIYNSFIELNKKFLRPKNIQKSSTYHHPPPWCTLLAYSFLLTCF